MKKFAIVIMILYFFREILPSFSTFNFTYFRESISICITARICVIYIIVFVLKQISSIIRATKADGFMLREATKKSN